MNLLPALEVLRPDESVVVEQGFGHNRVCRVDYRVVDWGQALPVSVVWAKNARVNKNWVGKVKVEGKEMLRIYVHTLHQVQASS